MRVGIIGEIESKYQQINLRLAAQEKRFSQLEATVDKMAEKQDTILSLLTQNAGK